MKRLVLGFAMPLVVLLTVAINAQQSKSTADTVAIRAVVTSYIEAYYTGDARAMELALEPRYLKFVLHGERPVREMTGLEIVQEIRKGPADLPATDKTEQVSVLDVSGNIASAKLVTPGWTDYMTLSKLDGQWKILSVVQRIGDH